MKTQQLPKLEENNKTEREVRGWGYYVLSTYPWTETHNKAMEAVNSPSLFTRN